MADPEAEARALPEDGRQLRLAFSNAELLRSEYTRNLRKGGAFVPTLERFELRELVEVVVELPYAEASFSLTAEVVLCMPPEVAPPGAPAGVAVQFIEPAETLRERVEPFLGPDESTATGATKSDPALLSSEAESHSSRAASAPAASAERAAEEPLEIDGSEAEPSLEFDEEDFAASEPSPSESGQASEPEAEPADLEVPADLWEPPEPAEPADLEQPGDLGLVLPEEPAPAAEPSALWEPPEPAEPSERAEPEGRGPIVLVEPAPQASEPEPRQQAAQDLGQPPRARVHNPFQDERRDFPREVARLPVVIRTATGLELEARSRDLSCSGALLSVEGTELPLGRRVTLCFVHPTSGERLEVAGRAVRHLQGEGTIPAAAVRFEPALGQSAQVARFVDEIHLLEERRRREGIRGPIAEMGVANLLQMFASSSPRGTLILTQAAEEGTVVFEAGRLLLARLGPVTGSKALARLLSWRGGEFEFRHYVDAPSQAKTGESLEAALLDALQQIDEEQKLALPILPPGARLAIDRDRLAWSESPLSKVEEAVVELVVAGFTVRRILDVIPESDAEIRASIVSLRERGILRPLPAD